MPPPANPSACPPTENPFATENADTPPTSKSAANLDGRESESPSCRRFRAHANPPSATHSKPSATPLSPRSPPSSTASAVDAQTPANDKPPQTADLPRNCRGLKHPPKNQTPTPTCKTRTWPRSAQHPRPTK